MGISYEITKENTTDVQATEGEAIEERPKDEFHGHSTFEAGNGDLLVGSSKIQTEDKMNKINLGKKIKKIIANVTNWRSSKDGITQKSEPRVSPEANVRRSNSLNDGEKNSMLKQNPYWACYSFRRESNKGTKRTDPQLDEYLGLW